MPTYEFDCENGHRSEQNRSVADRDARATCPECGARAVRALSLFNSPNILEGTFRSREKAEARAESEASKGFYTGPTRVDLPSQSEKKAAQTKTVMKDLHQIRESKKTKITVAA